MRLHLSRPSRDTTVTIAAFAFAFAVALVVALLQGAKPFYFDSGQYWGLSDTFTVDGTFSLLNFNSPLRGYVLPLIDHFLREIASGLGWNDSSLAKIFNAAVVALIATVLAPSLAALAWPERRWGFLPRAALAVLLLVFWRGYLNFPLSDFPGLAAVLLALVATGRAERPGWMLVAGLSTATAINMRPAYLLLIPVVVGLVAIAWWRARGTPEVSWARRAVAAALLVVGFAVISLPQSLSSNRHYDSASFVPGSAAGLSSLQFTEGMRLQRYETFVGTGQAGPRMLYRDESGSKVLAEDDDGTIDGPGEYLRVIAANPLDMAGVFVRHVVNGLDQRYETPYVENVDTGSQRPLRVAGFLVVFLALVRLLWPAARRGLGTARWRYAVGLALCGITSIASAVETRFLLPYFLLAYMLVVTPGWPNPFASAEPGARRLVTPAVLAVCLVVFMVAVLSLVESTTEHLQFG